MKKEFFVELFNITIGEFFNNLEIYPSFYLNMVNLGFWYSDRQRKENPIVGLNKEELYNSLKENMSIELVDFGEKGYKMYIYPGLFENEDYYFSIEVYGDYKHFNFKEGGTIHTCGSINDLLNNFGFDKVKNLLEKNSIDGILVNWNKDEIIYKKLKESLPPISWSFQKEGYSINNPIEMYDELNTEEVPSNISYFPNSTEKEKLGKMFFSLGDELFENRETHNLYRNRFVYDPLVLKGNKAFYQDKELKVKENTLINLREQLSLTSETVELYFDDEFPETTYMAKQK